MLVRRVRAGDELALERFMRRVTSIVRFRVARVLVSARRSESGAAPSRSHLLDLMQDVFLVLLDRDAAVLGSWDPARGLSLDGFVGLVAEREALSFRRSGRRSAWAEDPRDDFAERLEDARSPEERAMAREQLELLLDYLSTRLSPQGALMFEALYVANAPVSEICERFGTTPVAVYSFKNRLKQLVSDFREGLDAAFCAPEPRAAAPAFVVREGAE